MSELAESNFILVSQSISFFLKYSFHISFLFIKRSIHYEGKSLCVKAGEDPVVLMPKSKDLSFLAGRVASARKGC